MDIFEYGSQEILYLKGQDKMLGAAIDKIGMIKRKIMPDPFTALVLNVVSQQISKKAAETVGKRLYEILDNITPESVVQAELSEIQGCGMTRKKAGYIKGIGEAAISGQVDFKTLHLMSDAEVITKLTSLAGVGVWTAEMVLIFSLCRPDVVSYKDLAIRRGMMKLYGLTEISQVQFEQYRKKYSPYGSVASLYLWALAGI